MCCAAVSQAATSCKPPSLPSTRRPRRTTQTDWPQIVTLYDRLLEIWPSPVVALNRAVPLAEVAGPAAALAEVETLAASGQLDSYQYLPAVQADLLVRVGRPADAATAYRRALDLTDNDAEREFLAQRLASLE